MASSPERHDRLGLGLRHGPGFSALRRRAKTALDILNIRVAYITILPELHQNRYVDVKDKATVVCNGGNAHGVPPQRHAYGPSPWSGHAQGGIDADETIGAWDIAS